MTLRMLFATLLVAHVIAMAVLPLAALAQAGDASGNLDRPLGLTPKSGLTAWTDAFFRFGLILVVLAAAIYIAIGAFMYFAASGNAELAKTGKDFISRAIIGLVLGLVAWVILNTISPQFTELKDPVLQQAK